MIPALLIAGSGRSGTTWVQDALAQANGLRTVFEPLHPVVGPVAREYANRYLDPDMAEPSLEAFMEQVLDGRLHGIWTDYRVRPDRLVPGIQTFSTRDNLADFVKRYRKLARNIRRYAGGKGRGLAVKFIRANLMLGWLSEHFTDRILMLVRHPAAVIESKMRLGGIDWDPAPLLRRYLADERLCQVFMEPHRRFVEQHGTSPVSAHAIIWCIENLIPLREAPDRGYCIAFYERLLLNPEHEWRRLIDELSLDTLPDPEFLRVPSQQAAPERRIMSYDRVSLEGWNTTLGREGIARVEAVLNEFSVGMYTMNEALPALAEPVG